MEIFDSYRPYLFAIAYRMLGSALDAEDMVQETFVRAQAAPPETLRSPKAYLATILTRLCIDQLQLVRRTREVYVGPWLPEPVRMDVSVEGDDPARRVEQQESISMALLVLLEQLQPFERAVFVLRESFGYEFAEIAVILAKSEAACRRSFSRSKQHLRAHRPRFTASRETHHQLLTSFMQAVEQGDMGTLTRVLAEEVTLWADAGGKRPQAALNPIYGRAAVARFSIGALRFVPEYRVELTEVNGQGAAIIHVGDEVFSVLTIVAEGEQIQAVYVMANPDKLTYVAN